jgi:hypothetical protein
MYVVTQNPHTLDLGDITYVCYAHQIGCFSLRDKILKGRANPRIASLKSCPESVPNGPSELYPPRVSRLMELH